MNVSAEQLTGISLIAGIAGQRDGTRFRAYDPQTGKAVSPDFFSASQEEVNQAAEQAAAAAPPLAATSGPDRARLLRTIADGIDAAAEGLISRAHLETALPRPRLIGEVARTSNQLRLFAQVAEEGSWIEARIDTADPARTPPRPDLRSMLRPLGPVVVFGASNFPLAFSVAGGDTASALAAGNPVIAKAHPAHPGTSELIGHVIVDAIAASGLPAGVFSLLFDAGTQVGSALVQHPEVRAVGFTGSYRGGRALMDLAQKRAVPIPIYAEMGSLNPVFILPGVLRERGAEIAAGLHSSFTLGGGQFCTKPGVVFFASDAGGFLERIRSLNREAGPFALLSPGIAETYSKGLDARTSLTISSGPVPGGGFSAQAALLETDYAEFAETRDLHEELFGPTTLLVRGMDKAGMLGAARSLDGHLTATIWGTEEDLAQHAELVTVLATKAGRVIFNGFHTGVEVSHAMVHGGPYPATSDGRSTSVGSQAIFRFVRPVCYQNLPQAALPAELRDDNPLGLLRMWNGSLERR